MEAGAAELRERSAEFSRASEAAKADAAAERGRLEAALRAARAEAREIDSDVAQVLDALAASEKERRRLEAELDRQAKITGAARVATRAAEGAAAHVREDVDRERRELCERAGRLEGVVQHEASRLKESLEREAERRGQLEKECKALAARAADLEAALISASSEVRKAARLAAERGARHERDTAALTEEIARLKAALRETTAKGGEAETASAAEASAVAQQERQEAVASAVAEATERARREGRREEQEHTAEAREREERDCAALRREMSEITGTLEAETALRARAAQELSTLRRKVARLEVALERETATARAACDIARKAAVNDPTMAQLQAEMRSVISSLEQPQTDKSEEVESEAGGLGRAHQRRRQALDQRESGGTRRQEARGGRAGIGENAGQLPAVGGQEEEDRRSSLRRGSEVVRRDRRMDETADANAVFGDTGAAVVGEHPYPASPRRRSNAEVRQNEARHRMGMGTPPAGPVSAASSGAGLAATGYVVASATARPGEGEAAVPTGQATAPAPAVGAAEQEAAAAVPVVAPPVGVFHGGNNGVGRASSNKSENGDDGNDDDVSLSSVQSGVSSATRTSGMSSSFASAALPQPRRGSVVVRGDWKAGQREAFIELDRKASASSSPDDVGVGPAFSTSSRPGAL